MQPTLTRSVDDWDTDAFAGTLYEELRCLGKEVLPLHMATQQGGYVDDSNLAFSLLHRAEHASSLEVRVGIFFTEVVINCGCGVDPMPIPGYCTLLIRITRDGGQASFEVQVD